MEANHNVALKMQIHKSCFRLLLLCFAWQSLLELTSWVSSLSTQLSPGLKLTMVVSLRRDRQISCCSLFQGIPQWALNIEHPTRPSGSWLFVNNQNNSYQKKTALWILYMHSAKRRKYALRNLPRQEAVNSWHVLRLYLRMIKCRTKSYPIGRQ